MGLLSRWCCIACDVVFTSKEWFVRMPWMVLMGGGDGDEVEMPPSGVAGKRASAPRLPLGTCTG
jgi:hypothetical protein